MSTITPQDSAQSLSTINVTANTSVDRHVLPAIVTNTGATAAAKVTLPAARGGEVVTVVATVAKKLEVDPGSGVSIYANNGTSYAKQTAGKTLSTTTIGDAVTLVADSSGNWVASNQVGFGTVST